MTPEWIAAITVIAVQLLTAAVIFGSLQQQVKNNGKEISELKKDVALEQDQQWKAINTHTGEIAYLQGSQGANGAAKGASAGGHD